MKRKLDSVDAALDGGDGKGSEGDSAQLRPQRRSGRPPKDIHSTQTMSEADSSLLLTALRTKDPEKLSAAARRCSNLSIPMQVSFIQKVTAISWVLQHMVAKIYPRDKGMLLLRALLESGADPSVASPGSVETDLEHPVVYAARHGLNDALDLLVARGADVRVSSMSLMRNMREDIVSAVLSSIQYSTRAASHKHLMTTLQQVLSYTTRSLSESKASKSKLFINARDPRHKLNMVATKSCSEVYGLLLSHGFVPDLMSEFQLEEEAKFPSLGASRTVAGMEYCLKLLRGARDGHVAVSHLLRHGVQGGGKGGGVGSGCLKKAREKLLREDGSSVVSLQSLCAAKLLRNAGGDVGRVPTPALELQTAAAERVFGPYKERQKMILGGLGDGEGR